MHDILEAAQLVLPRINPVVPLGATRTTVYAIGQKLSGIAGNCGALTNAPTVVVTPVKVAIAVP